MKMFIVIDPRTDGDCFGGAIPEDHSALITAIPIKGSEDFRKLLIDEFGFYQFNVSGSGGPYKVIRVK